MCALDLTAKRSYRIILATGAATPRLNMTNRQTLGANIYRATRGAPTTRHCEIARHVTGATAKAPMGCCDYLGFRCGLLPRQRGRTNCAPRQDHSATPRRGVIPHELRRNYNAPDKDNTLRTCLKRPYSATIISATNYGNSQSARSRPRSRGRAHCALKSDYPTICGRHASRAVEGHLQCALTRMRGYLMKLRN